MSDSATLGTVAYQVLWPWNSPGKDTGVGSHSLLQCFFLNQESNLGLLNCWQILYHLSHHGNLFKFLKIFPAEDLSLTQHLLKLNNGSLISKNTNISYN